MNTLKTRTPVSSAVKTVRRISPAIPMIVVGFFGLVFPIVMLVTLSFRTASGFGIDNYLSALTSANDLQAVKNSLVFATMQAIMCVVLGTPIAFGILRLGGRARAMTMSFVNVASNFGGPGIAFAFLLLIGSNGVLTLLVSKVFGGFEFPTLGSMFGLSLVMLYLHLPLYLMLALPNYALLRDEWREAAEMAGASAVTYWRRVALPTLAPFVLGSGLQMFMWSMGAYSVPYVVTNSPGAIDLLSVEIGVGLQGGIFGLERPATLSALLVFQALVLIWIYRSAQKQGERIL